MSRLRDNPGVLPAPRGGAAPGPPPPAPPPGGGAAPPPPPPLPVLWPPLPRTAQRLRGRREVPLGFDPRNGPDSCVIR